MNVHSLVLKRIEYDVEKLPCCDVRKMPSSLRTQVTQGRRAPQGQDRFESSKQNYLVLF